MRDDRVSDAAERDIKIEGCTDCYLPEAPLYQSRSDIDFRGQCPMHWAAISNLQQAGLLFLREGTVQGNLAFDAVDFALLSFTLLAVYRMDLRVTQAYRHPIQGPALALRIQRNGHGGS